MLTTTDEDLNKIKKIAYTCCMATFIIAPLVITLLFCLAGVNKDNGLIFSPSTWSETTWFMFWAGIFLGLIFGSIAALVVGKTTEAVLCFYYLYKRMKAESSKLKS